jgi:uncharacterized repeat protein (TIGR03803 family)
MTRRPRFTFQLPPLAFALMILGVLSVFAAPGLAQTFTVLYNFTGGADGYDPDGVSLSPRGELYGATAFGGTYDAGTVFRLSRVNSSWILSPLYEFTGGSDGLNPFGGVTIGPNGALYGSTEFGGSGVGGGVVFELRPPPTVCASFLCYWNETVLHDFTGSPDGAFPDVPLIFDSAGNIYSTTYDGGTYGYGTAFEMTPTSGGGYTESVIHSFNFGVGGTYPASSVVLDTAGNLYGTTYYGGTGTECMDNCGTVYQLVPSGGGWTENVLVNFDETNGEEPVTNPILDASGNLYGPAGLIYKLTPSGGGFTFSIISNLGGMSCGYQSALVEDAAGNFYGTCQNGPGAGGSGWIYELTNCSQTCTVVDLHDFNDTEGGGPLGTPVMDANGNLYGTTVAGGTGNCGGAGCGVVWELTP